HVEPIPQGVRARLGNQPRELGTRRATCPDARPPVRIKTRSMHTTEPITSTASPTLGDMVAEIGPLVGAVYVAGPPVLVAWVGTVLFALMLAEPFALLVTLAVAL